MKQPKRSGRLLADIGDEGLKKKFYEILWKKDLTYTDWLKDAVKRYVKTWESEM